MNDVADENGVIEPRIKLIKEASIGQKAWDSNANNDWTKSSLMIFLNEGAYFTNNLTDLSKNMIDKIKWKLGGIKDYVTSGSGTPSRFYTIERGTNVSNGRPVEWIGEVGLMYPSDYGYATSGGEHRQNCILERNLYDYWGRVSFCYTNDWLFSSTESRYTMMSSNNNNYHVFIINRAELKTNESKYSNSINPVIFLNTTIKIMDGIGTMDNPFILE